MYYLQSRYYDPEIGRFLNADAFASTGQGILGNNMFAYCLNSPVNFLDYTGSLSLPCTISAKGYGGGPAKSDNKTTYFQEALFGAGFTTEHHTTQEIELMPMLLNLFISAKSGTTTVHTSFSSGNSDALFSVYAIQRTDDVLLSSVGAKININGYTADLSIGLDNIGITFIQKDGDYECSGAIIVDLTQLKAGIEVAFTTPVAGEAGYSVTEYLNVSVTGYTAIAILLYAFTGQIVFSPNVSPTTVPAT